MRDGIHKNAPVASFWRSLIKDCQNDSAWEELGPVRAERALLKELRADHLRPARLAQLHEALCQSQGVLIGGTDWFRAQHIEWSKECTPRERKIFEHLCRVSDRGVQPRSEHLVDAIEATLREVPQAHIRNIDGHLVEKFPSERPEMLRRLKEAVDRVPRRRIAEEFASGKQPKLPRLKRDPLHIDDDDLR